MSYSIPVGSRRFQTELALHSAVCPHLFLRSIVYRLARKIRRHPSRRGITRCTHHCPSRSCPHPSVRYRYMSPAITTRRMSGVPGSGPRCVAPGQRWLYSCAHTPQISGFGCTLQFSGHHHIFCKLYYKFPVPLCNIGFSLPGQL